MSAHAFDVFIAVATGATIAIFALAVVLAGAVLAARMRAVRRDRRIADLVGRWRRIFAADDPGAPPAGEDAFVVVSLWNDLWRADAPAGPTRARLLRAVDGRSLAALGIGLLDGDVGDRIVGSTFCGSARIAEAMPVARRLLSDPTPEVALAAHRLCALLDEEAVLDLAAAIAARDDWRPRDVESVLMELGPARISPAVAAVAAYADDAGATRILAFLSFCDRATARRIARAALAKRDDPETLAAALRGIASCAEPSDRDVVLPFLAHPVAFVRNAAIAAIGPIAAPRDLPALTERASDEDAWVRYRVARLVVERFADGDDADDRDLLLEIANDALGQVLAERSVSRPAPIPEERPAPVGAMRGEQ